MSAPATKASAEQAFLDDFQAHESRLAQNGYGWQAPLRASAMERFTALGLPGPRDEAWRKTSLAPLRRQTFRTAPPAELDDAIRARATELDFPDLDLHRLVFVDGRFSPELSDIGALPEGVILEPLAQASHAHAELVRMYLDQAREAEDEAFPALNAALMTDGGFLHLAAGAQLDTPVHLLFLNSGRAVDGAAPATYPRSLIVAGEGSRARLIETHAGLEGDDAPALTVAVTETFLAEGAEIDHTKRQEETESAIHLSHLSVRQDGTSRFATRSVDLGGGLVRNDSSVRIGAPKCETLLHGLYMAHGSQHVDNHTRLEHVEPDCHSFERFKGLLDDRATAVFTGRIYVHPEAQLTDAVQENSCVLLSRDAQISTQPQLEIFADDVKCTHGATVGELDEEQRFYLRTRGIPPQEARGIQAFAFANEVVEAIAIEPLREHLEREIRRRVRQSRDLELA